MGRSTAQALGFRKGTIASKYTQLYVGFLVSALIHEVGALCAVHHDTGELRFFLLQAVAITFEDIAIACAKRLGYHRVGPIGRAVGYLWTFCWKSYSLRLWFDPYLRAGMWIDYGMPYSVVTKTMELWRA